MQLRWMILVVKALLLVVFLIRRFVGMTVVIRMVISNHEVMLYIGMCTRMRRSGKERRKREHGAKNNNQSAHQIFFKAKMKRSVKRPVQCLARPWCRKSFSNFLPRPTNCGRCSLPRTSVWCVRHECRGSSSLTDEGQYSRGITKRTTALTFLRPEQRSALWQDQPERNKPFDY